MHGPFPGMDPYLEGPIEWPGVHARLIAAIGDTLAPQVAPGFIVHIEQRVYIATSADPGRQLLVPDVYLVRGPRDPLPTIAVPLLPPYPDATLDVQAVLDGIYERAFYAVSLDYARPVPPPPLAPPDAAWTAARVRDWRATQTQGTG